MYITNEEVIRIATLKMEEAYGGGDVDVDVDDEPQMSLILIRTFMRLFGVGPRERDNLKSSTTTSSFFYFYSSLFILESRLLEYLEMTTDAVRNVSSVGETWLES